MTECGLCKASRGGECFAAMFIKTQLERYSRKSIADGHSSSAGSFKLQNVDGIISDAYRKLSECLNNEQLMKAINEAKRIKEEKY